MAIPLKQATASQVVILGPFMDASDGKTPKTGLTIAAADLKIWKHGATALVAKNSGGATELANGLYYCTLDATDTSAMGGLVVICTVTGIVPKALDCECYPCAVGGVNLNAIDGLATNGNNATLNLKQLNIVNSAGDAVVASSTGSNGRGIIASGNGSGAGLAATGGATGAGMLANGGGTSGDGFNAAANGGNGRGIIGTGNGNAAGLKGAGGATGNGIEGSGGATSGAGLRAIGTTSGAGISATGGGAFQGISATGGATGSGAKFAGGATSGHGIEAAGPASGAGIYATATNNQPGIRAAGDGTGNGLSLVAGATGHGLNAAGGATSGNGINAVGSTLGDGLAVSGAGTGKVDFRANMTGNVTGNVSGSVGSVTADVGITQAAADKVWGSANRGLTTFGTLVADIATAIWGAGTRTLTAFGFTPSLDAAYNAAKTASQAGDAMALTSGERTTLAGVVEGHMLNEADGQALLAAIVSAINTADVSLAGLSTSAIATAVKNALHDFDPSSQNVTVGGYATGQVPAKVADLPSVPTAAANASAVRTELTTELGRVDAAITTRLAASAYTAPPSISALATGAELTSAQSAIIAAMPAEGGGGGDVDLSVVTDALVPIASDAAAAHARADLLPTLSDMEGSAALSNTPVGYTAVTPDTAVVGGGTLGLCLNSEGAPLFDTTITAYASTDLAFAEPVGQTVCKVDGSFVLWLEPGATYTLLFHHGGQADATKQVTL